MGLRQMLPRQRKSTLVLPSPAPCCTAAVSIAAARLRQRPAARGRCNCGQAAWLLKLRPLLLLLLLVLPTSWWDGAGHRGWPGRVTETQLLMQIIGLDDFNRASRRLKGRCSMTHGEVISQPLKNEQGTELT